MNRLNLSEWALRHPQMVLYLIVVLMLGGAVSFDRLGRAEDQRPEVRMPRTSSETIGNRPVLCSTPKI